jgi:fructose-bisphosphate aldolase, class II
VPRVLNVPVLVGTSEGERNFLGVHEIVALVTSLRRQFEHPIFLNADHTHSLERAVEAAQAGYDMIGFDASTMALEKNIGLTKQAVEAVNSINPRIIVEGELGFIGSGSEIHESVPESSRLLTKTEDARCFVEATKIDVLAPAVGNMHGLLKSMITGEVRKRLDIDRIREIATATAVPLTLHGGSGTDDGDFQRAISAGVAIVHISTVQSPSDPPQISIHHGQTVLITDPEGGVVLAFPHVILEDVVRREKKFGRGS